MIVLHRATCQWRCGAGERQWHASPSTTGAPALASNKIARVARPCDSVLAASSVCVRGIARGVRPEGIVVASVCAGLARGDVAAAKVACVNRDSWCWRGQARGESQRDQPDSSKRYHLQGMKECGQGMSESNSKKAKTWKEGLRRRNLSRFMDSGQLWLPLSASIETYNTSVTRMMGCCEKTFDH